MPHYEYHCASNGHTVEVRHGMNERLETWGEVARLSDRDPGDTPKDAPVERIMSAPVPHQRSGGSRGMGPQGCGSGCACVPNA